MYSLPEGLREQPDMLRVMALASGAAATLANTVGDTATATAALNAQLDRLPIHARLALLQGDTLGYRGMLALLSSDDQVAESEDSLAILFSRYLESAVGRSLGVLQIKSLRDQLRHQHMSNTFLGLELPGIPTLRLDIQQLSRLTYLRGLREFSSVPLASRLTSVPAAWYEPVRKVSSKQPNQLELSFTLSTIRLREHLVAVKSLNAGGTRVHEIKSDAVEFRGVSWCMILHSTSEGHQLLLGLKPTFLLRQDAADQLAGIYIEFQYRLDSASPLITELKRRVWIGANGFGTDNFVQAYGKREGDPTELDWWKDYFVDGHVRFSATVTIL